MEEEQKEEARRPTEGKELRRKQPVGMYFPIGHKSCPPPYLQQPFDSCINNDHLSSTYSLRRHVRVVDVLTGIQQSAVASSSCCIPTSRGFHEGLLITQPPHPPDQLAAPFVQPATAFSSLLYALSSSLCSMLSVSASSQCQDIFPLSRTQHSPPPSPSTRDAFDTLPKAPDDVIELPKSPPSIPAALPSPAILSSFFAPNTPQPPPRPLTHPRPSHTLIATFFERRKPW